jgi:hypothetical protein
LVGSGLGFHPRKNRIEFGSMQVNHKTYTTLLLGCVAISVVALSGCRAGGFQKPNLGKLAFWKAENSTLADKDIPPPPARHFDPVRINGEPASGEIVELDNQNLRNQFDNDIEQMRSEINQAASAMGNPIRKPYASGNAELTPDSDSRYPLGTNKVESKLAEFDSYAKSELNTAQNDFQAAMSNKTQSLNNDFSAKAASTGVTSGWKEDFPLPSGLSPNKSLADISKSIQDANSKVVSGAKTAANSFSFTRQAADLQNAFQPNLDAVAKANDIKAQVQNKLAQSVKPDNSFAAGGSLGNSTTQKNPDLEMAQAQILEAKQQIEELKQQVALANRQATTAPSTAVPSTIGPVTTGPIASAQTPVRTAQLQIPGFNSNYTGRSETEPTNVLRSTNQPLRPQMSQPLTPQINDTPGYPSTPHGGFSPQASSNEFSGNSGNFSPLSATPASQVNFQTASDNQMIVTANDAPASPTGFAGEHQNHVSEIDIPDSVLRGSGSYAPGSVQPLN